MEAESIKAILSSEVWDKPHDETAVIAMKFTSGATAEICPSVLFKSPSRLEVRGECDYFICEDTLGAKGAGSMLTSSGAIELSIKNPFVEEIESFVDATRTDNEPEVTGEQGLRNVEILSEVASGGWLSVLHCATEGVT